MEKNKVNPDYLTRPMWELQAEYGSLWLAEQNKLFNTLLNEVDNELHATPNK